MNDLRSSTSVLVPSMDFKITVLRADGVKDPHRITACKCYVSLAVDGRSYTTNMTSFKNLVWDQEFTIPFTGASHLSVAIYCVHDREAKEHVIAQLMDFDIFKSNCLEADERTLSLSPTFGKGRPGSITLRVQFDQTCKNAQLTAGIKDTFARHRIPDGSYIGMTLVEGIAKANIAPPSWAAIIISLSQIAEAAKRVGGLHNSAKVALGAVSVAIQIVMKQRDRDSRMCDLLEMIASIYDLLHDTKFDKITSFENTIQRLLRATTDSSYFIADYCKTESFVRRAVEGAVSSVDEIIKDFERRFSQLRVEFLMGSAVQVAQMAFLILEKATNIETLLHIQTLPWIKDATWSQCPKGAHSDVIDEIISWVHTDSEDRVYLLLGDAQSGKSFIAHSISQIFAQERRLGSSIFFSNTQNNTRSLASTMARELCALNQGIAEKIAEAISMAPTLPNASLNRQFHELIITPLKMLTFVGPILVVVDGLDHCEDPEALATFIEHIPNFPPNFRFLITSRLRADPIQLLFNFEHYHSHLLSYDVATHLELVIHHVAQQLGEQTFPSSTIDAVCEVVTQQAESRACALLAILHALLSRPKEQVAAFISQLASTRAELPMEYKYLSKCPIRAAWEVITFPASNRVAWPALFPPIWIPGGDAAVPAPSPFQILYQQTIHYPSMSYEEFLLKCQIHHGCIDIMDVQGSGTQPVKALDGTFTADTTSTTNDSIASAFGYVLDGWISGIVQTGLGSEGLEAILDELRQMFGTYFIKWVDVMKLLGCALIGKMVHHLEIICHWLQGKIPNDDTLRRLAVDGLRFVQLHQRDITKGPLHALTLIKGIPTGTTLYHTYKTGDRAPTVGAPSQWPRFTHTLEGIPNLGPQPTTECGVAYSPDGMHIAAIQGASVGIWEANSGTLVRDRARMSNPLRNLVLSPDFTKLLAQDRGHNTLYRWELDDTSPPEHLRARYTYGIAHGYSSDGQTLFYPDEGRLQIQINGNRCGVVPGVKDVDSATISPDNTLIAASCGATKTIFIFKIQTLRKVLAIRSKYPVAGLAWPPCGVFLVGFETVSCLISLWDSSTGKQLSVIKPGRYCYQFAISPDSTKLILVSDSGIDIWDISDTSKPSRLEFIPEGAHSVAISPDGRRFVVGAYPPEQPRIRVYDIESTWKPQPIT